MCFYKKYIMFKIAFTFIELLLLISVFSFTYANYEYINKVIQSSDMIYFAGILIFSDLAKELTIRILDYKHKNKTN